MICFRLLDIHLLLCEVLTLFSHTPHLVTSASAPVVPVLMERLDLLAIPRSTSDSLQAAAPAELLQPAPLHTNIAVVVSAAPECAAPLVPSSSSSAAGSLPSSVGSSRTPSGPPSPAPASPALAEKRPPQHLGTPEPTAAGAAAAAAGTRSRSNSKEIPAPMVHSKYVRCGPLLL
jgi:hypothetical protein